MPKSKAMTKSKGKKGMAYASAMKESLKYTLFICMRKTMSVGSLNPMSNKLNISSSLINSGKNEQQKQNKIFW